MKAEITNTQGRFFIRLLNLLNKNERQILLLLLFITIFFRIIFVYITYTKTGTSKWSDDFEYIDAAEQIAKGNWDLKHGNSNYLIVGPSLPLLGAIFLKLFNNLIIPFFIYNILMTSLMVPVLYFLGKEVFNAKARWSLALWGIFFYEAFKYCPHILKESTLFLFIPLTLLFLVRTVKNISPVKNIIFASLSFGWLIHTDERFIIYFPLFALFFLLARPFKINKYLRLAGTWIIFVLLLMLPWGVRNFKTFNQIVIITPRTTAITSRFWGQNLAGTASHFSDEDAKQKLIEGRREGATQFGNEYGLTLSQYGNFEARTRAFINFWQPAYFRPTFIQYGFRPQKWSIAHNVAGLIFYGIFLPFYLIGFALLVKKKYFVSLFLACIPIFHSLLHAYMVWPLERYRSPVTFIIVMIGIYTMYDLNECIKETYFKNKDIIR